MTFDWKYKDTVTKIVALSGFAAEVV